MLTDSTYHWAEGLASRFYSVMAGKLVNKLMASLSSKQLARKIFKVPTTEK